MIDTILVASDLGSHCVPLILDHHALGDHAGRKISGTSCFEPEF